MTKSKNPDAKLFERIKAVYVARKASLALERAHGRKKRKVLAMRGYPKDDTIPKVINDPADFPRVQKLHRAQAAFEKKHGAQAAWDALERSWQAAGKAANAVFATPARTMDGAIAKLCLARYVVGIDPEMPETGCVALSSYQNYKKPWIDNAIADVERMAKGGRS